MKRLFCLVVVLLSGCRLSDPIYAFKPLTPAMPPSDDRVGLVVGTVQMNGHAASLEGVVFRRVAPGPNLYFVASDETYFRGFRHRTIKDGTFSIALSPGVYELDHVWTGGWPMETDWKLDDEAATGHRVYVTQAGVYDLGTLAVKSTLFGSSGELEFKDDQTASERQEFLKTLVHDTEWERLPMTAAR